MQVHQDTWTGQIKNAMNVNGGDIENASTTDYVMHFLTFGWKVWCFGENALNWITNLLI